MRDIKDRISIQLTKKQNTQLRYFCDKNNKSISEVTSLALIDCNLISSAYQAPKVVKKHIETIYYYIPDDANVKIMLPIICRILGVDEKLIYSNRQRRPEATARHCLRYFLMDICCYSSVKAAYLTNRADHSTILHSVETWSNLCETMPNVASLNERIRTTINEAL